MKTTVGVPLDIVGYLKGMKIKPSLIRVKVLDYLIHKRNHPTADMIFKALAGEIPTLSKTSVYNTLKSFVLAGVAQEIKIENTEVRYDVFTNVHGHFKCTVCGSVEDLKLDAYNITSDDLEGKKITEHHVYVLGFCSNCNKKKNKKNI
ncbi:MAG: Fur family transcriptional regulator [bacterium]